MHIGLQAPEETCFTWSNPRQVSFQFNQEPSWLPIYRHLTFPRSVSLCQNTIGTERLRHYPQNFGVGHAFFLLFNPRNSKLKKNRSQIGPQQLHGSANSSIELLSLPSTHQQSETNWMNVCPTLTSAHYFLKNRNPKKNISYSTKTPNSKKNFRINIIANICKPRIKSSVNGFLSNFIIWTGKKNF